jgi:hypothetical protein
MSSLFGSPSPAPTTPVPAAPKPPAPMPDSSSPAVLEARRRAQMDIMGRAGRSSTILSAPKDRGGDYTSTTLGAGS